jgi:hypothetical protein
LLDFYLKNTYNVKVSKSPNTEHENCKFLVSFFCGKIEPKFWGREIKIAKQLLKEYPEIDIWQKIVFKCKLPSLAFFLTDDGKKITKRAFLRNKLVLPEKKDYNLGEQSKTEETVKTIKPKSVFGFLNS